MKPAPIPAAPGTGAPPARRALTTGLALVAVGALLLVFHNYAHPILPRQHFAITPAQLTPHSAGSPHVMVLPFDHSEPNRPEVDRSAVILLEDGLPYSNSHRDTKELLQVGGRRWVHEPGRIIFSTRHNSDPRTNGQSYALLSPVLYTRAIANGSVVVFLCATAALYWLVRRDPVPARAAPGPGPGRWRWHLAGATLLFLAGLYCNTGTLAPYAITTFPHRDAATGYLYNPDHGHFRALFDFVDGAERDRWDGAIMLRRILYPVAAWPFMKLAGFEVGGALASLFFNVAAFLLGGWLLRRRIGERGAVFALWLLALYPGAAYWGGLPYAYSTIAPLSLLLLLGLAELTEARGVKFAALAVGMGVAFLAYDFAAFFLPATLLALAWRRRFGAAAGAMVLMLLPFMLWLWLLARGFDQSLLNSNTVSYRAILDSYLQPGGLAAAGARLPGAIEPGLGIFFGSNFLFLPGLFLLLVAVNPLTARVRLEAAETALFLTALAIFLFNHLAPAYGGWQMRGTWIARIYQPVFPVFILFAARWWQHLPPLRRPAQVLLGTALAAVMAGNALIVFGPILNNPLRVSETAYYRFYNHNENHWVYVDHCLREFGRHPLGFHAPAP